MYIYICINILLCLMLLFDFLSSKKIKDVKQYKSIYFALFSIFIVFLILFVGLRTCGFDYELYMDRCGSIFNSTNWLTTSIEEGIEPGFGLLSYLLNYRMLLLILAVLTLSLLAYFLYKNSPYPFLSLFLYLPNLYIGAMGQTRQALAIVICLLAFTYITKSKKTFITLSLIAAMFHITALISFIVLLIPKKIKSAYLYTSYIIGAYIINIFGITFLINIISYFPSFLSTKLHFYLFIYDVSYEGARMGFDSATILRFFILFLGFWVKESYDKNNLYHLFYNIYFLGVLLYIACGFLPTFAVRLSYTFTILDMILLPMILYQSINIKKYIVILLISFIIINRQMPILSSTSKYYPEYVPYKYESIL